MLSTIASTLPLDVVVTCWHLDLDFYVWSWMEPEYPSPEKRAANAIHHRGRFKVFNEMYKVREFLLVLFADVLDCIAERAMGVLEYAVAVERTKGGLDCLLYEPVVISEIRPPRTRTDDNHTGNEGAWCIYSSAL